MPERNFKVELVHVTHSEKKQLEITLRAGQPGLVGSGVSGPHAG